MESDVIFDSMDLSQALLYIHLNEGCVEMEDLDKIRDQLRKRKRKVGKILGRSNLCEVSPQDP